MTYRELTMLGIFVDPARVAHPRDKARVERQVQYVRGGWFAGENSTTLDDCGGARRTGARKSPVHACTVRRVLCRARCSSKSRSPRC
jgi:hypothetical protein